MKRALPLLSLVLAVSACSQDPETTASSSPGKEEVSSAPTTEPEAVDPLPSQSADSAGTVSKTIPKFAQGRWGLNAADCTASRAEAQGLMEVSADHLKFYEAVADLQRVKEQSSDRIRATFTFSGEGESWTQDVVLNVKGGGNTMIRQDHGSDAMPDPITYTRCS